MEVDAEQRLHAGGDLVSAHRLAGLGATELQHMPAGGMVAIVVVEGDDAVHLGARQVELLRNDRQALLRDIAELRLDLVQDGQKRPFQTLQCADNRQRLRSDIVAGDVNIHDLASQPARMNRREVPVPSRRYH